jgi:carboxymethylenebutenolidase
VEIDLEWGTGGTRAYRVEPRTGSGPGVLVVHEGFGLDGASVEICDRLGREGFVSLAPDLLAGATTFDARVADERMRSLDREQAIACLGAASERLRGDSAVSGARPSLLVSGVAAGLALEAAGAHAASIGSVVVICGLPAQDEVARIDANALRGPVLAIVGDRDPAVEQGGLARLELRFRSGRAELHVHSIKEAGAHFASASRPDCFDAIAEAAAWDATLAFLRATS